MPGSAEARSPRALLDDVERAREVLILTYTATLEFFERFALADARALGALVTVISDATMVHPDPVVVRRAGTQYLDGRALCPAGAFHPKLVVVVGDGQARVAIGSGNLTMAGWHANAELWTVLRADEDGGPATLRQVSSFLRDLAASRVTLSPGAKAGLGRVADQLDELPAPDPGPTLLHSLHTPIAEQLPQTGVVDELVLYSPFHDGSLGGARALLDRFQPVTWTAYVQAETDVDGDALGALAASRSGRVAWVAREARLANGEIRPDERYWHGKLVQWRSGETQWALTGSPNLSAPALLRTVADGNCEIALLTEGSDDLQPADGKPPPGGLASLTRSPPNRDAGSALVLLSATAREGAVALELSAPLAAAGVLERYDVSADRWRESAPLPAGSPTYDVELGSAPIGQAVRIVRDDHATSNSVFVADPERLRRRQERSVGKVRATPAEVARLGLGEQLLADLDELRSHLLHAGATVPILEPTAPDDEHTVAGNVPAGRPAPGVTLEDYLAACDPVLGQRMTEFALVLPALPGVGAALDDAFGTLDVDVNADEPESDADDAELTLGEELRRRTSSERNRYRRFLERLIGRAHEYPLVVRNLAAHSALHAVAAGIWPEDRWPAIVAEAINALGAPGDEPNAYERDAAASLAAVGLALLRTDVAKLSRRDEQTMRYEATGRAVAPLLPHRAEVKVELLGSELLAADPPRRVAAAVTSDAAERAIADALERPRGAARAARLLGEDHGLAAVEVNGKLVELRDVLDRIAEPRLLLALSLADDHGPIYVRGRTAEGRRVVAAWRKPWLAIEREGPAGRWGRAWKLSGGQTPAMLKWDDLPRASCNWAAGEEPPDEVADLLGQGKNIRTL